jgi:hypothetical protein
MKNQFQNQFLNLATTRSGILHAARKKYTVRGQKGENRPPEP